MEIVFDHCQSLTIADNVVMTRNDIEADVILLTISSEDFVSGQVTSTIIGKIFTIHQRSIE
jgi:hypothetical protein